MELGVDPLPRAVGTGAAWRASRGGGSACWESASARSLQGDTCPGRKEKAASSCVGRHFFKPVNPAHTGSQHRAAPCSRGPGEASDAEAAARPLRSSSATAGPILGWRVSRTFPTTREMAVRPRQRQVPVRSRAQAGRQRSRLAVEGPALAAHGSGMPAAEPSATSRTARPSNKATAAVKWGT